jgi:hypothetical protein
MDSLKRSHDGASLLDGVGAFDNELAGFVAASSGTVKQRCSDRTPGQLMAERLKPA